MSTEKYIRHAEAKEDAERLSRNLKRDVEAVHENCDCDYDKNCGKCGSKGYYYELRYVFCRHLVTDSDEECETNDCRWAEYKSFCKADEEREGMEAIAS